MLIGIFDMDCKKNDSWNVNNLMRTGEYCTWQLVNGPIHKWSNLGAYGGLKRIIEG